MVSNENETMYSKFLLSYALKWKVHIQVMHELIPSVFIKIICSISCSSILKWNTNNDKQKVSNKNISSKNQHNNWSQVKLVQDHQFLYSLYQGILVHTTLEIRLTFILLLRYGRRKVSLRWGLLPEHEQICPMMFCSKHQQTRVCRSPWLLISPLTSLKHPGTTLGPEGLLTQINMYISYMAFHTDQALSSYPIQSKQF